MKAPGRRLSNAAITLAVLACAGAWLALGWYENAYDRPYHRVEDGLYIGEAIDRPPRGTKAVVNLCGRPDPYQVEAALWDPVEEGGPRPSLDWLRRVVGFIAEQRAAGRPTFVHCRSGVNRSGAAVTAYLMHEHGWGRDAALAFLRDRRPEVQPNPAPMRLLAEWERELAASPPAPPP